MSAFRKRPDAPVIVDAVQWIGQEIAGLDVRTARIQLSAAGDFFYCTKNDHRPAYWISTEKFPGPVTDERKAEADGGIFAANWAQFAVRSTGEVYHRKVLPFTFWKVKTGGQRQDPIGEDDERFLDNASLNNWPAEAVGDALTGYIDSKKVSRGDWIVTYPDGLISVFPEARFAKTYEPA